MDLYYLCFLPIVIFYLTIWYWAIKTTLKGSSNYNDSEVASSWVIGNIVIITLISTGVGIIHFTER